MTFNIKQVQLKDLLLEPIRNGLTKPKAIRACVHSKKVV